MIAAIKFPPIHIVFPLLLGLYNGLIKYFYQINTNPYIIENDIIILGLFYIVSWLVGSIR